MKFEQLRVRTGHRAHLERIDPEDTASFPGGKRAAEASRPHRINELDRLQELLYADGRYALLIVLQGMDTSGKDGTVRHVFEGVNPQGVRVRSFKAPTPEEASHDFLWRVHPHAPGKGEIAIFNRSQYEDVLAARVHRSVPVAEWSKRFDEINAFERELKHEGTTVLKFFLHISRAEQTRRLQARIDDPTKQWKLSPSDLQERKLWSAYMRAYEAMLGRTSTPAAPWYIVPADHKWFRNLVVSTVLVETLRRMGLRYPAAKIDPTTVRLR
jgi:PPK2 family polyphosphate:nucleotide phosphotransferase